jgi:hypothetical protein
VIVLWQNDPTPVPLGTVTFLEPATFGTGKKLQPNVPSVVPVTFGVQLVELDDDQDNSLVSPGQMSRANDKLVIDNSIDNVNNICFMYFIYTYYNKYKTRIY